MDARLPPGLEAAALIRQVNASGGFAAVIRKGDAEAGTLLLVLLENGGNPRVFERMPQPDGSRSWHCIKRQVDDSAHELTQYIERRTTQDADLWVVELDIAQGERFIG